MKTALLCDPWFAQAAQGGVFLIAPVSFLC
jgi:hypothetical protein